MKPLIIQFSGGRTSAFMTKFLFEHYPEREKHVLFENTGKEDERTLEFVAECDRRWTLGVAWLEAVVHYGERKSCTHKVVTYETASRNGEPYEAVIQKYGLPYQGASHCTRELKINTGKSYIKSLGLKDYEIAIGIRADEEHRIDRARARQNKNIYPLVDIVRADKRLVNLWWSRQDFDLRTPPNLGNCDLCFKKSIRQLASTARECPAKLDWWEDMERRYGGGHTFFRGNRSARDVRELAAMPTLFSSPELEVETDCFCKST